MPNGRPLSMGLHNEMIQDLVDILWLAGAFLALFALAELLFHVLRCRAEYTRKMVHVLTGVLTLLFPVFLQSHWSVLLLCAAFAVILLGSLRWGWLPSINAIDRKSYGSLLYPLAVYLCFLFYAFHQRQYLLFYLPVLCLALCDPVAALAGKSFPFGKFRVAGGQKTVTGCAAFFITCLALTQILTAATGLPVFDGVWLFSLTVAFVSMLAEALSGNGWDNLSIPVSVLLVLHFFMR